MSEMTEAALRWAKRNRAATRDEVVAMAAECLRLRARVAELEADLAAKLAEPMMSVRVENPDVIARVRRAGAKAMRERAAAHVDAEGDAHKEQARQWRNPAICASHDATMIVCYRLADEIRALPLDDDAREEGANVCEHGDHPAPEGQRFCSRACQECEVTDAVSGSECAGICGGDAREGAQGGSDA